jgi:riboflavin kinase/FMN adenylyltransferase
MRIYRSLEEARASFAPSAVTIGNFDGVHVAHRELMRTVVALARDCAAKPSALTFTPHPTQVVAPERAPRLLTSLDERCALMELDGVEQALILPFNAHLSTLGPEDFFREVLVDALGARAVVVGDNFLFGARQSGDVTALRELGAKFGVRIGVVPAVKWRGVAISSSAIRQLLATGDVSRAARLLGRPFAVSGQVVSGAGRGRRQTVPTLNLEIPSLALDHAAVPAHGVYITRTHASGDSSGAAPDTRSWRSITNVGHRPTFGGHHLTIETYLLDAFQPPTPERIRVEFLRRVRAERAFPSPEELRAQILRDVERAQVFFRRTARLKRA